MRKLNQKGSSMIELLVTLAILSIIFSTYLYFTGSMFDQVENIEGKIEVRNMTNIIAESIFHNPQQFQAHFKKEDLSEGNKARFLNDTLAYSKLDDQRFNSEGFCDKTTCPNAKGRFAFLIIPVSDGEISLYEKDESGDDITTDSGGQAIDPNKTLTTTGMMKVFVRVYQDEKTYKDFESVISGSGL